MTKAASDKTAARVILTPAQRALLLTAEAKQPSSVYPYTRGGMRVARACYAKGLGYVNELEGSFAINKAGVAAVGK